MSGESEETRLVIPDRLAWLADEPAGAAWLRVLPERLAACAQRWSLDLGPPYTNASVSYVAPATAEGKTPVVLKIQYPHPECRHEAEALRSWNGRGVVRLLEHAPEHHALLLERCEPGTSLGQAPDEDIEARVLYLLRHSLIPAGEPFDLIHDQVPGWQEELRAGRSCVGPESRPLLQQAMETLDQMAATLRQPVLVNQDLHRDNILRARREPWLMIDPKPLLAEPEYALANRLPMFGRHEYADAIPTVAPRLDRLAAALELSPARVRAWAFVRAVWWALDDPMNRESFLATARTLADGLPLREPA